MHRVELQLVGVFRAGQVGTHRGAGVRRADARVSERARSLPRVRNGERGSGKGGDRIPTDVDDNPRDAREVRRGAELMPGTSDVTYSKDLWKEMRDKTEDELATVVEDSV